MTYIVQLHGIHIQNNVWGKLDGYTFKSVFKYQCPWFLLKGFLTKKKSCNQQDVVHR